MARCLALRLLKNRANFIVKLGNTLKLEEATVAILKTFTFIFLIGLLQGCATKLEKGYAAYKAEQYDLSRQYWQPLAEKNDPAAQYLTAKLWEHGVGATPRDLEKAMDLYYLSANNGYLPAMTALARLQIQFNEEESAFSWLRYAARWDYEMAKTMLKQYGRPIPTADFKAHYPPTPRLPADSGKQQTQQLGNKQNSH